VTIIAITIAGIVPSPLPPVSGIAVFGGILAGAALHLVIDLLACPGIPLLAPISDRKFTAGLLPGPSILLLGSAIVVLVSIISGRVPVPTALAVYGVVVLLYLASRTGMFLVTAAVLAGRRVPTINPLRWLEIAENNSEYSVRYYMVFSGFSEMEVFEKCHGTDPGEVKRYLTIPEVRRLMFNSYITIAGRSSATLFISAPLREKGYLYYPPKYKRVAIPIREQE
jgi:inner membrane protein